MPFTPFHLGPGCATKAVMGRYFSLSVFGFAQVAIDLEPLIRMIRGDAIVHGLTHTYIGATGIGAASLFIGRPICQWLLNRWKIGGAGEGAGTEFMDWLRGPPVISWPAAATGAFIGTYSHVFLDSIIHADMQPLAPFLPANHLLGLLSINDLHLLCACAGVVGFACLVVEYLLFRRRRMHA